MLLLGGKGLFKSHILPILDLAPSIWCILCCPSQLETCSSTASLMQPFLLTPSMVLVL